MNIYEGYRVTSGYGGRLDPLGQRGSEFHRGIDLVKPNKAPIFPFVAGLVVHAGMGQAGTGLGGYGNVVAVKDSKGTLHCYCHLDSVSVRVGQAVGLTDEIGHEGTTGRSTGPHLHYEVRTKCEPSYGFGCDTDPTNYLKLFYEEDEEMKEILERLQALEDKTKVLDKTPAPEWFIKEFGTDEIQAVLKDATGDYDFWRNLAITIRFVQSKK
jgi:murein DD-endopeptidase MepM/ murein hydrolase activator NlpD